MIFINSETDLALQRHAQEALLKQEEIAVLKAIYPVTFASTFSNEVDRFVLDATQEGLSLTSTAIDVISVVLIFTPAAPIAGGLQYVSLALDASNASIDVARGEYSKGAFRAAFAVIPFVGGKVLKAGKSALSRNLGRFLGKTGDVVDIGDAALNPTCNCRSLVGLPGEGCFVAGTLVAVPGSPNHHLATSPIVHPIGLQNEFVIAAASFLAAAAIASKGRKNKRKSIRSKYQKRGYGLDFLDLVKAGSLRILDRNKLYVPEFGKLVIPNVEIVTPKLFVPQTYGIED